MGKNAWWLVAAGLLVSFALAFGVSRYASSQPDGLERVAADHGFDADVRDHALANGPFADYSTRGVDDSGLSTGVAGLVGVVVTFAAAMGVVGAVTLVRRRGRGRGRGRSDAPSGAAAAGITSASP